MNYTESYSLSTKAFIKKNWRISIRSDRMTIDHSFWIDWFINLGRLEVRFRSSGCESSGRHCADAHCDGQTLSSRWVFSFSPLTSDRPGLSVRGNGFLAKVHQRSSARLVWMKLQCGSAAWRNVLDCLGFKLGHSWCIASGTTQWPLWSFFVHCDSARLKQVDLPVAAAQSASEGGC